MTGKRPLELSDISSSSSSSSSSSTCFLFLFSVISVFIEDGVLNTGPGLPDLQWEKLLEQR